MLQFSAFLTEASKKSKKDADDEYDDANGKNDALGMAYETLTALHVHNNSASAQRMDPNNPEHAENIKRINAIQASHETAMAKLSPEKQQKVREGAKNSANAYLKSLAAEGINPENIIEVHHTNRGIDKLIGRKVSQAKNPPDIGVRLDQPHSHGQGPNKDLHFASLKLTPGTASNNGTGAIDKLGKEDPEKHIPTKFDEIWKAGRKVSGIGDRTISQLSDLRRSVDKRNKPQDVDPEKKALYDRINQTYQTTRQAVLAHHKEAFDGATLAQQREHLSHFMKASPDASYHYVVGEKGGKSVPIDEHPNVVALRNAKSFHSEVRGSRMHVYDHLGRHLLSVEHRSTHGPWSSTQANAKFESLKVNKKIAGQPTEQSNSPISTAAKIISAKRKTTKTQVAPVEAAPISQTPVQRPSSGGFGEYRGDGPRHYQAYVDRTHGGYQDSGI
jgi:hypothetical protein